ncbi:transcriptional regulator, IclR family [Acidimicrobium ferrooxidans DSM 10331]|uniref:Glycerol operon regulatory protein n=1 Tax=Acidimicrobium ferrooxidans (strain DSM 10331 / JCM 15462 / NBRC 103882 / ICP) TaxID=525909 RepID=C7M2D6_ACIFD|nr:IclR family transcriptional regulator C-terminal domain-containing protein [Acidimicrobium ferrooxidans]ACU54925.1 transcriptional regulator, IclR family [Acidimicrobium ferrooxidans DSM 10331]
MVRRSENPDFVESLARGLDVLLAFGRGEPASLVELATRAHLARPTAHRILATLAELGYVRQRDDGRYELTPRVLDLGTASVLARSRWEVARPHLEQLVAETRESSSIAVLDGSDVLYVARVAVPKIVAIAVTVGTRFPASVTSLGKVLLADLDHDELERTLAVPSRSPVTPRRAPALEELRRVLANVRERGWALTDEELAVGIRSIAVALHDPDGKVVAAVNVNVHAAETSLDELLEHHLPRLIETAKAIDADVARIAAAPLAVRDGLHSARTLDSTAGNL